MNPFNHITTSALKLPRIIQQKDPDGGVLRPWVRHLPLRYQGVLLTAIRGCDGAPKEDPSKHLSRMIRRACLNPADPRESEKARGFFGMEPESLVAGMREFFHSLDQYPLHYVSHLMHASQVIAYSNSECANTAQFFVGCYLCFCRALHLNPESRKDMYDRLTRDRIADGTTESDF